MVAFAIQQVLGVVAGPFLLTSEPPKIGDEVVTLGNNGRVKAVSTLFAFLVKTDVTKVMIPYNIILGNKVYLKSAPLEQRTLKVQQERLQTEFSTYKEKEKYHASDPRQPGQK
ncbi:mechanosensitive ion channel domain-containing protein [Sulfodiicoccus acidiphilus]|uniref:mechanosensitive ion channel domain-containing protein n=1 Tax=Sulfodiicoccus acidiphilus TaxID=1670455 RepID=UPI003571408C